MAEALAEYWHRRIREELGFADEDGPTLTGLFRQKYRGGPVLVGLPGLPRPRGQRQGGRAARRRPHRHRGQRGVPARAGAVDHRHHLPPSASQVLRGLGPACADTPVAPSRWSGPRSDAAARRRHGRRPCRGVAGVDGARTRMAGAAVLSYAGPPLGIVGDLPAAARLHGGPARSDQRPADRRPSSPPSRPSPQQAEAQFNALAAQPGFGAFIRLWTDRTGSGPGGQRRGRAAVPHPRRQ